MIYDNFDDIKPVRYHLSKNRMGSCRHRTDSIHWLYSV